MLTPQEKVAGRKHMGYLGVQAASTFYLGIPAGVQTQFVIESSFTKLMPESEVEYRRLIAILDGVEAQIFDNQGNLAASKVGEIEINPREFEKLIQRYLYWQGCLGNLLGCIANPFDQRFAGWSGGGGGVNMSVQH